MYIYPNSNEYLKVQCSFNNHNSFNIENLLHVCSFDTLHGLYTYNNNISNYWSIVF